MKELTAQLAAHLLKEASELFSNHGCNDLDRDTLEMMSCWTDQERTQFMEDADEWNKGPTDLDSPEQMPDWMVMDVVAYQLKKYANGI